MAETKAYYVTRYGISQIDSGTRRVFLTEAGNWTPNQAQGQIFGGREEALAEIESHPELRGAFAEKFTVLVPWTEAAV